MVTDLFRVMDLNMDGHIDLTELIQMVALTCRGSNEDPHKREFPRTVCDVCDMCDMCPSSHTVRDVCPLPAPSSVFPHV